MDKCLKFALPSGSGGFAASFTRGSIIRKLRELKFNFSHRTETYTLKVWLENDSDYTHFYLVWEPTNSWHKAELIEEDFIEDESSIKAVQITPKVKKE